MGYNFSDFTLKVDPAVLQREASDLCRNITKVQSYFDSMLSRVEATEHYWKGDAADKYRSEFLKEREEYNEAIAMIREYVNDLNAIAAVYTGVEAENEELADVLVSDVIV